jgi:hypothetical protein
MGRRSRVVRLVKPNFRMSDPWGPRPGNRTSGRSPKWENLGERHVRFLVPLAYLSPRIFEANILEVCPRTRFASGGCCAGTSPSQAAKSRSGGILLASLRAVEPSGETKVWSAETSIQWRTSPDDLPYCCYPNSRLTAVRPFVRHRLRLQHCPAHESSRRWLARRHSQSRNAIAEPTVEQAHWRRGPCVFEDLRDE